MKTIKGHSLKLNAMVQISVKDPQLFPAPHIGRIWSSTQCVPCGKLKTNTQSFQNSEKTRPAVVNTSSDTQFLEILFFSFTCIPLFCCSIPLNLGP